MYLDSEIQTISDCKEAAACAGLTYAAVDAPGIRRRRVGRGFTYRGPDGRPVTDVQVLRRIKSLAIPPAWSMVWICPDPDGHIQATGYDAKGRKQYRYHPKFREVRECVKYEHMMAFAEALPCLRAKIGSDMKKPGLGREKVLATVVHLLETTMIRVGNEEYAKENNSYGLTTLLSRHVKVDGQELKFHFKGKSGKEWRLSVRDRRIAKIVRSCQELPGQHLFQYFDDGGNLETVTSADVNAYLRETSGRDITTKDFRTWTGTVLAAMALAGFEKAGSKARAKKNVTRAVEQVAARLGNTAAICRKCYVHPEIVSAYLDGGLPIEAQKDIGRQLSEEIAGLRPEEVAVLFFLRSRLARKVAEPQAEKSAKEAKLEEEMALPPQVNGFSAPAEAVPGLSGRASAPDAAKRASPGI
jgi:DNA topoisomerase I